MRKVIGRFLDWYFTRDTLPYWIIIIIDSLIVFLSGCFVYWLFNRTMALVDNRFEVIYTMLIYVLFALVGFRTFHTYSGIVRLSSFVDLMQVAYGGTLSLALALPYSMLLEDTEYRSISILSQTETVITFVIAVLLMWAERVVVKVLYDNSVSSKYARRVLIYGTLTSAVGLAKEINVQHPKRFRLRGFISDEARDSHIHLMGRKVYHTDDDLAAIIKKESIRAILISQEYANVFRNNQELQNTLIGTGCKIYIAQGTIEARVKDGELKEEEETIENTQLKEVSVEDLLPRSEIKIDLNSVSELLKGKRVLITGAAGSIGSEIVRQVASFEPEKMMLIDMAETPEHDIRLMLANEFPNIEAHTLVTSICKEKRMELIFSTFRPDYVFHAAAYKHVPMMEDNPSEAVQNNIYGTKVIADLSVKYGVKKFVMISTDKAVNPTNVMGCSKRICEIYVQSLNRKLFLESNKNIKKNAAIGQYTQFVTTRFGNVLGSNGSVIPLFQEQIKRGGPVTVTDKNIVRYFMLIPEACKLVLEAGTKGNGGEIFVFDMGKPVKIADLARRMIALSGVKDVEIKFTGLREGEKLYEEVLNNHENTKPTFHEKIRIAEVREYDFDEICKQINELIKISKQYDDMATVSMMKEIVPEYKSNNSVYEQLDIQK